MSDKETLIQEIRVWIEDNWPKRVSTMGNYYSCSETNYMIEGIRRILENHSSEGEK